MATQVEAPILFFDGVCNFCDWSVQFVLKRNSRIRFAALQSAAAERLLPAHGVDPSELSTMAFLDDGRCWTESTAALRVAGRLSGGWPLLSVFLIVPRPIRDWAYRFFARRRYRWFGRRDSCRLPTPEERSRFLD